MKQRINKPPLVLGLATVLAAAAAVGSRALLINDNPSESPSTVENGPNQTGQEKAKGPWPRHFTSRFDPLVLRNTDEPLSAAAEKEFFDEVDAFFAADAFTLDEPSQNAALAKLNARMRSGVSSALNYLKQSPADTDVMHRRMSLVEYLRYRSRWDPKTKAACLEYVTNPVSDDLPLNIQGMKIQEKAELMQGIAAGDPTTIDVLSKLQSKVEKRYVAASIAQGLRSRGLSEAEIETTIAAVYPDFPQHKNQ